MTPNPALGVALHWLGGFASGSFYVPYRGVKHWAWETFWLAGGMFSWIIAPWFLGVLITKDLGAVLSETPKITLFWTFLFGLLWGIGGLTFGLTMRYLCLSLGMAVVLGLCAAFGTLMPPIFRDRKSTRLNSSHLGNSYAVFCLKKKKKALSLLMAISSGLPAWAHFLMPFPSFFTSRAKAWPDAGESANCWASTTAGDDETPDET